MSTNFILLAVAIPFFILTLIGESLWIHRSKSGMALGVRGYSVKDTAASLAMGIGYLILNNIWKLGLIPIFYWVHEMSLFSIPTEGWYWWALLIVLQDFCFYWYHRYHHELRVLWAAHVNHHSSERYNLSTALRQSWTAMITSLPFFVPLIILGFDPIMYFTVALLNLFYQYWIHTEIVGRLGPLEWVFMTASHHRVHHGANEPYLDKNYGGIFIIWDKMFGTFEPEAGPVVFGLTKNIKTFNPVRIAFHEWAHLIRDLRHAKGIGEAWGYVVNKPGWKPESTLSSGQPAESSTS